MSASNNREAEPHTQREWAERQYGEPIKSLRDEYAMAALPGIMESIGCANPAAVARDAYAIANAMMAERGGK